MELSEEKLKKAMNRVNPPDGFVARVMARAEAQPAAEPKSVRKPYSPWLAWWKYLTAHPAPVAVGAIAVMTLIALGVGMGHTHIRREAVPSMSAQERMAGEKARDQMMLALKITGEQLSRMNELLSQPPQNGLIPGDNKDQPGFSD